MRMQTTKNIQEQFSHVRGKVKDKLVVLVAMNLKENVFNLEVLEPKVKLASSSQDYKVSQVKLKLNQVSVVDKINLHKQTREVIFSNLIHSPVNINRLKVQISK